MFEFKCAFKKKKKKDRKKFVPSNLSYMHPYVNSWKHSPFLYRGNVVGHGTEDKGLAASLIDTSSFRIMALK